MRVLRPTLWAGRLEDHGDEEEAHPGAGCAQADCGRSALAEGKDLAAVCRELGVAEATYHRWRNQFGGLKAEDAKRLKDLERENTTLKRLLADAELEKAALKEIARDAPIDVKC
jgi:putative transposase